jgi:hypothetical protein
MPQVDKLGSGGINIDTPPMLLPPNVFSEGINVRFRNNCVEAITGEVLGRTLPMAANFGVHWRRPDQGYNIFGRDGQFIRVDSAGNQAYMLNSGDSSYTNSKWQSTYFNGGFAIIFNNGKSTPIYCLYGDVNAQSTLQPLPNWNYIAGLTVTAKVIRSLNYSLVAGNLTLNQSGITTYAPGTIRVSSQSPTGSVPQTWQPGVTTDTADEFEISSTSPVLDMAELRGGMYIYCQDSISVLTIDKSMSVVKPYSKSYGILNTNCVTEFDGNHFVVDNNDIYVHNGSGKIESVAETRIKNYFFKYLNKNKLDLVNVFNDKYYKEIWICFPKNTSNYCNEALIYNYFSNTWTIRQLTNVTFSFTGPSNIGNNFQYAKQTIYFTTNTTQTLISDDSYGMYNGTTIVPFDWAIGKRKLNTGDVKGSVLVSSIYTVFDSVPETTTINIYAKGQNNYNKDIAYTAEDMFVFDANNERSPGYKVDPRVNGRVMNFLITGTGYFKFPLYDLDAKPVDRR